MADQFSPMRLKTLKCKSCNTDLKDNLSNSKRGSRFEDCRRRCDSCGVAYSNAQKNPRLIYRCPSDNIPKELIEGLTTTLGSSINSTNRKSKRDKFCSENSEDALTWTVFKYLLKKKILHLIPKMYGIEAKHEDLHLLLWGTPLPPDDGEARTAYEKLLTILKNENGLNEKPNTFTEPDVILFSTKKAHPLIFIEVKYKSKNEQSKAAIGKWEKYKNDDYFNDYNGIIAGGYYELARNWRIGCEMAGEQNFILVNLVPKESASDSGPKTLEVNFSRHLKKNGEKCRFEVIHWQSFLTQIGQIDNYFKEYLENKKLL